MEQYLLFLLRAQHVSIEVVLQMLSLRRHDHGVGGDLAFIFVVIGSEREVVAGKSASSGLAIGGGTRHFPRFLQRDVILDGVHVFAVFVDEITHSRCSHGHQRREEGDGHGLGDPANQVNIQSLQDELGHILQYDGRKHLDLGQPLELMLGETATHHPQTEDVGADQLQRGVAST